MYLTIFKPFTLLFFLLILFSYTNVVAQGQGTCPNTITVDGRTVLCQGETTTLKAPTGTGLTYAWLRDGNPIGVATPTLQVSVGGIYQVRVSGPSCGTSLSGETQITVNPRPSDPAFIVTPTPTAAKPLCSGDEVTFSINAPQPNVTYTWLFGDGKVGKGPEVKHTYKSIGVGTETFRLKTFATNAAGCQSDTVFRNIVINKLPEVKFSEEQNFQVCLPDSVAEEDIEVFAKIKNETVEPYLSDIRTYFVDWGNGEVQQYTRGDFPISNPTAYDTLGTYPISISVIAGNGCQVVFKREFNVNKEPKANIDFNKRPDGTPQDCTPVVVALGDSSSGGGLSYKWTIQEPNNGGYELIYGGYDKDSLEIRFSTPGVFNIELIVNNSCGADTANQSVIVGYPQVQLPGDITACGDTTIKYSMNSVFYDPNFAAAGTMKYEWFVDGPGGRRTSSEQYPEFNFTQPGEYTVSARVTNNCGSSDDIGQTPPPQKITINPLPGTPVVTNYESCVGDRVTIVPTGAGSVYEFYEGEAGGTPIATGPTFVTPTLAGNRVYYIAAVSTQGCPGKRVPVNITVEPAIDNNTISTTPTAVCAGSVPGKITGTTPTGGVGGAYLYTWQISTTGPDAGFIPAPGTSNDVNYTPAAISQNTWYRRIVNSGNCSADTSESIQITAVPQITNNTITGPQEICQGQIPNTIVGTRPTGGAGSFTYSWQVSTTSATDGFVDAPGKGENFTFSAPLTQNTWIRRVVTSNGCAATSEPVKISVFPVLANNSIESDQAVCIGSAANPLTGTTPTGGNGNYIYRWQSSTSGPTGGFTAASGTNNTQGYVPGTISQTTWYRRIVKSASCDSLVSNVVTITVNPAVTNNVIGSNQTICEGEVPAALTGNTDPSYTYRWEFSTTGPGAGFSPAAGANGAATYTPPALTQSTWFRRVVITGAGCQNNSEPVAITVNKRPAKPTLATKNARACLNGPATLSVTPNPAFTYNWYTVPTGGEPIFTGETFQIQSVAQNTTYYVEAVDKNSSCGSATRTEATVTIVEPVADAGPDVTIIQGKTIALRATGGATYLWEPAEGLSDPKSAQPVASPKVTTTYVVTVTTAEGCVATDEVTVTVIPAIDIPNAFTPNRDGVNETWEIKNIEEYPDVKVEIFNRWGNKIFTSNGYNEPWDGTFNGSELPVATYYYMIYLNNDIKPIAGHVTIIR